MGVMGKGRFALDEAREHGTRLGNELAFGQMITIAETRERFAFQYGLYLPG